MKMRVGHLLLTGLCLFLIVPCAASAGGASPEADVAEDRGKLAYPDPGIEIQEPLPHPPLQDREITIAQGTTDFYRPSIAAGGMVVWYSRGTAGMGVSGLKMGTDEVTPGKAQVIADGPGDQSLPFVAADTEHGGYLVVWQDQRDTTADIYVRYLDANGRPQGEAFALVTAAGDQLRPTAAYVTAADGYLVVWQDGRAAGEPDVYARFVPTYGTSSLGGGKQPLGKEFAVSLSPGGQFIPTAACEATRARCLVAWQDNRQLAILFTDVMGRVVDAAGGTTVSDEIAVAVASDYQYSPVVVFNPASQEYLVVWDDDISARRVSTDGQPIGGKIYISLESPAQYKPVVAVAPDGTYLIVWEDLRNLEKRGADIYGQWLSPSGRPLGVNFALTAERHNQYSPAIVAGLGSETARFLVVWEDDRAAGAILSLYGLWVSRSTGSN